MEEPGTSSVQCLRWVWLDLCAEEEIEAYGSGATRTGFNARVHFDIGNL